MGTWGIVGNFLTRYLTAFAISCLVFAIPFTYYNLSYQLDWVTGPMGLEAMYVNLLDGWAICAAVIAVVVLVVAYPMERWVVSDMKSLPRIAFTYLGIVFGLGIVLAILGSIGGGSGWIVGVFGGFVGAVVAFIGRLFYPLFQRIPKVSVGLGLLFMVLAILGPAIPPLVQNAVVGKGIFPPILKGEIARATWYNFPNSAASSDMYDPHVLVSPGIKYQLLYKCGKVTDSQYTVDIENSHTVVREIQFGCSDTASHKLPITFKKQFDPSVRINPDPYGYDPDAYAILVPARATGL